MDGTTPWTTFSGLDILNNLGLRHMVDKRSAQTLTGLDALKCVFLGSQRFSNDLLTRLSSPTCTCGTCSTCTTRNIDHLADVLPDLHTVTSTTLSMQCGCGITDVFCTARTTRICLCVTTGMSATLPMDCNNGLRLAPRRRCRSWEDC